LRDKGQNIDEQAHPGSPNTQGGLEGEFVERMAMSSPARS
jgi:hypothetical protein